jgi:glutathione S-transferase
MARLYHNAMSPFCRKLRLILAEKRIECELIEERYWERDPSFIDRNPAGKVPVLEIDGNTMSESAAICEYLEEKYPNPTLLPVDIRERYEVRRLVGYFDDTFYNHVTKKLVFEIIMRKRIYQGDPNHKKLWPDTKAVKDANRNCKKYLDDLGSLLDQRFWLAGDTMTLADFAAAAHISVLDYMGRVNWNLDSRAGGLKDWYAKIKSRPAFRSILADQIPGFPQPSHYADLDF